MPDQAGPIFVAGCPRSGTSAMSWALANNPGLWTSAETHYFYYLLAKSPASASGCFERSSSPGSWLERHGVSFGEFLEHLGTGLDRLMTSRSNGLRWIDGSPENILVGEQLLQMFPRAQIIHVVRDPRAVCRSTLSSGFPPEWARDLKAAIQTWHHYVKAGAALADACPDRVTEIRQEEMLGEPNAVAAKLAARLGLQAPDYIARFLATKTVNSSFDRSSQAGPSGEPAGDTVVISKEAFCREHGALIFAQTGEIAGRYGYV